MRPRWPDDDDNKWGPLDWALFTAAVACVVMLLSLTAKGYM